MDEATSIRIAAGVILAVMLGGVGYVLWVLREWLRVWPRWLFVGVFIAFCVVTAIWGTEAANDDEQAYRDDFECTAPPC